MFKRWPGTRQVYNWLNVTLEVERLSMFNQAVGARLDSSKRIGSHDSSRFVISF